MVGANAAEAWWEAIVKDDGEGKGDNQVRTHEWNHRAALYPSKGLAMLPLTRFTERVAQG
jgi:hypothetical protein